MRVAKLSAPLGLAWIRAGWRLFGLQPINFATVVGSYFFAVIAWVFVTIMIADGFKAGGSPGVGDWLSGILVAIAWVFTPGISVGFMEACKTALSGLPVYPSVLLRPFRHDKPTSRRLVALGILQLIVGLAIAFAFGPMPTGAVGSDGKLTPDGEVALVTNMTWRFLATLPVVLVFWYAPVLVCWHKIPVAKSIFFSTASVWRNRSAFFMYGVGWLACSFVFGLAAQLVAAMGLGNFVIFLLLPLMLGFAAVFYCSTYVSYSMVFGPENAAPGR